jgi:hypothetical protein
LVYIDDSEQRQTITLGISLGDDKRKGNISCEILTREKRMIICAKKEEENARKNPSHIYIYMYIYMTGKEKSITYIIGENTKNDKRERENTSLPNTSPSMKMNALIHGDS